MPALVTANFRLTNAKHFVNSFQPSDWGGFDKYWDQSFIYMFIGKPISWSETHAGYSDTIVPAPEGDVQGNSYEPWRDMIALDRVANSDIVHGAKRTDWSSGTVYDQYDDQDPSITRGTKDFFVRTDLEQVFKCLDNAGGAESVVAPTKPPSEVMLQDVVPASDGYRWKYMYTIPSTDSKRFLSTNYMPVRTLNAFSEFGGAGAGTPLGWDDLAIVQSNANAGTLETYVIVQGGSGYTAHSGGVSDGARKTHVTANADVLNPTVITLTSDSGINNINVEGAFFVAYSGTTILHSSNISVSSTGASQVITLAEPVDGTTTNISDTLYHIAPKIEVAGDGQGANLYATITTTGPSGIDKITTLNSGNNYTTANVTVHSPDNGAGSGANIRAIISPPNGHGYDPVSELNGWNVIVAKTFSGNLAPNPSTDLTQLWPIANEYRIVGLLKNPILANGYSKDTISMPGTSGANWFANSTPLHQATWIIANTTPGTSTWTPGTSDDEEIIGLISGAEARIVEYNGTSGKLVVTNVVANTSGFGFFDKEQIALKSDETSYIAANGYITETPAASHDPQIQVIYTGELISSSGDILYLENRTPITRSTDQAEDIKLIIEF